MVAATEGRVFYFCRLAVVWEGSVGDGGCLLFAADLQRPDWAL